MRCIHFLVKHSRIPSVVCLLLWTVPISLIIVIFLTKYLNNLHLLQVELTGQDYSSRHLYSNYVQSDFRGLILYNDTIPFFNKTYRDIHWKGPTKANWKLDTKDFPNCSSIPPNLVGPISTPRHVQSFAYLANKYPWLEAGGHYKPQHCKALHRVAIIVPYRDREKHLKMFLEHMHWFLRKQELDYAIFIIELVPGVPFNRALLMNVGYAEAIKQYDFQCFVFHDVDLLPENDRNLYSCPRNPRHLSVAVSTMMYRLPYGTIFGGATAMTRQQFELVNGFSNLYFGWGGEDDDMYNRIMENDMKITRYSATIARYKMLGHSKDRNVNPHRHKLLDSGMQRWHHDGINSLYYKRLKIEFLPLYTKVLVAFPIKESLSRSDNNTGTPGPVTKGHKMLLYDNRSTAIQHSQGNPVTNSVPNSTFKNTMS